MYTRVTDRRTDGQTDGWWWWQRWWASQGYGAAWGSHIILKNDPTPVDSLKSVLMVLKLSHWPSYSRYWLFFRRSVDVNISVLGACVVLKNVL